MLLNRMRRQAMAALLCALVVASLPAQADVITDWNAKACEVIIEARPPNGPALRALAVLQTAVYLATNAVTHRYPDGGATLDAPAGASLEAAIAAANRAVLIKQFPAQAAKVEAAYSAALGAIADGPGKEAGVALGEKAVAIVLARRKEDANLPPETYRPYTAAGKYVPTVIPVGVQAGLHMPWVLASVDQFLPGPPPALGSERWARDYNEIKKLGARVNSTRTAEQTAIAKFWEATLPPIYYGVLRSVAVQAGREPTRNARLFAAASQAMDDAIAAVMQAKHHYGFWRPVTAIRNGDIDGNDATERDPAWLPFIETPMHPEYPCAHCILSGTIGTLLKAETGKDSMPTLSTSSYTAQGATRSWTNVEDFIQEVAVARIYDGVHYRNSTEVGTGMGRKVGALVAERFALGK